MIILCSCIEHQAGKGNGLHFELGEQGTTAVQVHKATAAKINGNIIGGEEISSQDGMGDVHQVEVLPVGTLVVKI